MLMVFSLPVTDVPGLCLLMPQASPAGGSDPSSMSPPRQELLDGPGLVVLPLATVGDDLEQAPVSEEGGREDPVGHVLHVGDLFGLDMVGVEVEELIGLVPGVGRLPCLPI